MRSIRTYLKLALLCTVLSGFVGCSNNDDIVPENKNEKLAGPKPAKVVINVIEGHLHGYAAFHENKMYDGVKHMDAPQEFVYTLQDDKWVPDPKNPPYLYAMSYNQMQNSEAAVSIALDIKYYDAAGNLMNGKFIDNGQSEHYQHFFVVKDQKPFPNFDAKLDNPTNQEFMRYDYVDPTPWNETIHSGKAQYNGLKDPLGFKGILSFGYCRQTCNLNIMLMESHNKKTVNLKNLVFKDTWGEPIEAHSKVADWVPTSEQLKNNKWYPTINLPVMVYMDRAELGEGEDNVTLTMTENEVPTSFKRLVSTLKYAFNLTYKQALTELYYRLNGEPAPHDNSGYWF